MLSTPKQFKRCQQRQLLRSSRYCNSLRRQRGVAIVVALFIVALVAAMSYAMMSRLERDTRRTTLIIRNIQAESYAQGSIAWAVEQLRNNWLEQKPNKLIDVIPMKSPVMEMNGYHVQSTIYDMQARFNLNNLINADDQKSFVRLARAVIPKLSQQNAEQIASNIHDWIVPASGQNRLSKYYAGLPSPYRKAGRLMSSVSELRLVKGVTPAIFMALHPYLTALPEATMVNVQTASAPVLLTLSPNMTLDAANSFITLRNQTPIVKADQFANLDIIKNHQINADKITVVSKYFLIETDVSIENQHVLLYTLLVRNAQDKKAAMTILWQSKGIG